ncbi:MAG: endonuclease III [Chloroflexi bacterium]|nr:endonuclease III [Chloroflexota bacterium]
MPKASRSKATLSPAEIIERLSALYGTPVWRPHGDGMTELILTVLSQNTSDTNSGRAFMRLRSRFPDWHGLLSADPSAVEEAIQVGGLARTKSPRLKAIVEEVWSRRGDFDLSFLAGLPLDEAKGWLRSLPGVGAKTAACVLMFAYGRPALPVDTHVHRVAQRLGLVPGTAGPVEAQERLEAVLPAAEVYPFHISLIRHGRRLCRAQRPLCPECPLLQRCPYGRSHLGGPAAQKGGP